MTDERDIIAMAHNYADGLKRETVFRMPPPAKPAPPKPLSAFTETHKRSEKVTTVTIEFERMPIDHFTPGWAKMVFTRTEDVLLLTGRLRQLVRLDATFEHEYPGFGTAVLHPNDTFDWEIGMREAARDLVWNVRSGKEIFRAFRRWMWLEKQAWELGTAGGCDTALADDMCDYYEDIIAREFGRVTGG